MDGPLGYWGPKRQLKSFVLQAELGERCCYLMDILYIWLMYLLDVTNGSLIVTRLDGMS